MGNKTNLIVNNALQHSSIKAGLSPVWECPPTAIPPPHKLNPPNSVNQIRAHPVGDKKRGNRTTGHSRLITHTAASHFCPENKRIQRVPCCTCLRVAQDLFVIHSQLNQMQMKSFLQITVLIGVSWMLSFMGLNAQVTSDSALVNKEYNNLEEALRNPEQVFRLNLSNQHFSTLPDSIWRRFENLEYLSLKNDHLKEIPVGIGDLKNLKILDLSNNDFTVLPPSFSRLENLREIYLNDEKKMDFEQSLRTIRDLPNLKILHLENDKLESLPQSLLDFTQLEALYLNNNRFQTLPAEIKKLKKLTYIDLHDNRFNLDKENSQFQGSGIRIRF